MKRLIIIFIFFLTNNLFSLPPNTIPSINNLINSLGKSVPSNATRINPNEYSLLLSRDNNLTIKQNFFIKNKVVNEAVYLWISEDINLLRQIQFELYDYLESLGRIQPFFDDGFYVIKNGYVYVLNNINRNDADRQYVQISVIIDN